jgi:HEAT repeat protein
VGRRSLGLAAAVVAVILVGLTGWGPIQEMRARDIVAKLRSADPKAQLAARDAMHHLPPLSTRAAAVFASALRDPNPNTREAAARALSYLGPLSTAQVPELIAALADDDDHVREAGAAALGAIGPAARSAESALRSLLQYRPGGADFFGARGWLVRARAAQALGSIGSNSEASIMALQRATRDEEPFVASSAREALSTLAPR